MSEKPPGVIPIPLIVPFDYFDNVRHPYPYIDCSDNMIACRICAMGIIIPALSKESSGILLLPLSVRPSSPSVRKKSLSLELRLHFKDLRNDTLGSHWVCLVDVQ